MGIKVEVDGQQRLNRQARNLRRVTHEEVVDQIHTDVRKIHGDMHVRALAFGRMARRASSSLDVTGDYNGSTLKAGGSGLSGLLFWGTEFGGRRRRRTYVSRRGDRPYVIFRRRTTMMFLPFLGHAGYYFMPALRQGLVGEHERLLGAMARAARKAGNL